ncbi:hypothetical protein [Ruegeria lacuscaerulensis]|uniref:hypothetical protein n=1 Tax=Ruegeria lacuscaerulensis TaxID=55218 RepID=UPI00147D6C87|nr:hypothetical protein [Ruegeria lacuscaerulensis]
MTVFSQFMTAAFQDEIPNFLPPNENVSTLTNRNSRVRVPQNNSHWARELKRRLNDLTSLKKGWDGYAGQPVSFNVAQFAANLIETLCIDGVPAPQLVPGSDGTMQLEWHLNGYDIEIDVLAPFDVVATRYDHISNVEDEIEIQSDFTELADWMLALGENRAMAQVAEN